MPALRTWVGNFAGLGAIGHTGARPYLSVPSSMLIFSTRARRGAGLSLARSMLTGTATALLTLICCTLAPRELRAAEAPAVAELGTPGAALVADSAHRRLFVSLPASEQLAVIDDSSLAVTRRIVVGGQPAGLALRETSGELLIALAAGHGFAVIDGESLTVTRYEFALPPAVPGFDQVADMGHGRVLLYSAAAPDQFAVFDESAPRQLQWSAPTVVHQARRLEFDRAQQRLYTTHAGHFVVLDFAVPGAPVKIVDSAQLSDGSLLTGRALADLRFDPAGQRLVSGDGLLFDPLTLVPGRDLKAGQHSVLSADGHYLFNNADDGRVQRRGLRDATEDQGLALACVASEVTSLVVLADGVRVAALADAQVCATVSRAQRRAMLAAAVAPRVPSPLDLFPSHVNAKWTFKKTRDGSIETNTIVAAATIDKHPVWKILYADKSYSFRQVTADQASEVRSVFPLEQQTATSVPPNLLVKNTDQIGNTYVQSGYVDARQGSAAPKKITYRQTRKSVGFTKVKLAFGSVRALRIDYTIAQTYNGETRNGNGTVWVVPGLGEVQIGATGKPSTVLTDVKVDPDKDGINAKTDNCLLVKNRNQIDTDHDKSGNACDTDDDADGIPDTVDNCPVISNVAQTDTDNDDIGDSCDTP